MRQKPSQQHSSFRVATFFAATLLLLKILVPITAIIWSDHSTDAFPLCLDMAMMHDSTHGGAHSHHGVNDPQAPMPACPCVFIKTVAFDFERYAEAVEYFHAPHWSVHDIRDMKTPVRVGLAGVIAPPAGPPLTA